MLIPASTPAQPWLNATRYHLHIKPFFAAELDRPETVIRFITDHKDDQESGPDGGAGLTWGVEPMCAVLTEHGIKISPSTYYEWIDKQPTKRQQVDIELLAVLRAQPQDTKIH